MKKLLALVLALVMTLGLATVGANAALSDFKDADDINYEEAVAVMDAIGVMKGDETGFRPADQLKRSEGAKIVAYFILGNKAAEAMQPTGSKFSDLPANHWAAKYMEYLASVGVMGGVGDGKIDPDGTLTATAFGKMLLCAIGYDADIEGFGGTDWSINVQKVANTIGLYDGNRDVVGSAAVTREEAALYAFNALISPEVEYDTQVNVQLDNGNIKVGSNKATEVTSTADWATNIFTDTGINGRDIVEFGEEHYKDLELVTNDYITDSYKRPARQWTYNNKEVGTFVARSGYVTTLNNKVTAKQLYDLFGKAVYDSLVGGYTYIFSAIDGTQPDGTVVMYRDNGASAYAVRPGSVSTGWMNRTSTYTVNGTGNGSKTEIYMDEDGNIYLATINTWVYQALNDYDSRSETITLVELDDNAAITPTLTNNGRLALEDFPEIADLKTDDYVLVEASVSGDGTRYAVENIAKAEVLTGKVDSYNSSVDGVDGKNLVIDGTAHNYSLETDDDTKNYTYVIGQNASVVLDKLGHIIAVDEALVLSDYVFITNFGSTSTLNAKIMANAIFADGTEKEIQVKEVYDYDTDDGETTFKGSTLTIANTGHLDGTTWGANLGEDQIGKWYTFSKNSSNEYVLYAIEDKYAQYSGRYTGADVVTNDSVVDFFDGNADTIVAANLHANDKTVVVVKDQNGDLTVYTGIKNIPGIEIAGGTHADASVVAKNNGGYVAVAYIELDGAATIKGAANDNLIYVIKNDGRTRIDNGDYWRYIVLKDDGTEETIQADRNINANTFYVANFASRNAKDQLSNFNVAATSDNNDPTNNNPTRAGTVIGGVETTISESAGTLVLGDSGGFTLADGAKIMLVTPKASSAALNVNRNADYEVQTNLTAAKLAKTLNDGTAYAYGYTFVGRTTSATSTVLKELYVTAGTPVITLESTSGSEITKALADGDANVTSNGNVTLTADTTVDKDDRWTVNGRLTVTNGATLTIDSDNAVTVGSIYVDEGASVVINKVSVDNTADPTLTVANGGSVYGTITINGNDTTGATRHGVLNLTNGTLRIYPTGDVTKLAEGTITGAGATVRVDAANSLNIKGSGNATIGTLSVYGHVAIDTTDAGKLTVTTLTLEKDANVTVASAEAANTALEVTENLTVKADAALDVDAKVTVGGNLLIADGSAVTLDNDANVAVTGTATINEAINANAAAADALTAGKGIITDSAATCATLPDNAKEAAVTTTEAESALSSAQTDATTAVTDAKTAANTAIDLLASPDYTGKQAAKDNVALQETTAKAAIDDATNATDATEAGENGVAEIEKLVVAAAKAWVDEYATAQKTANASLTSTIEGAATTAKSSITDTESVSDAVSTLKSTVSSAVSAAESTNTTRYNNAKGVLNGQTFTLAARKAADGAPSKADIQAAIAAADSSEYLKVANVSYDFTAPVIGDYESSGTKMVKSGVAVTLKSGVDGDTIQKDNAADAITFTVRYDVAETLAETTLAAVKEAVNSKTVTFDAAASKAAGYTSATKPAQDAIRAEVAELYTNENGDVAVTYTPTAPDAYTGDGTDASKYTATSTVTISVTVAGVEKTDSASVTVNYVGTDVNDIDVAMATLGNAITVPVSAAASNNQTTEAIDVAAQKQAIIAAVSEKINNNDITPTVSTEGSLATINTGASIGDQAAVNDVKVTLTWGDISETAEESGEIAVTFRISIKDA